MLYCVGQGNYWGNENQVLGLRAKWCSVLLMMAIQCYPETAGQGGGLTLEAVLTYVLSYLFSLSFESFHCSVSFSDGHHVGVCSSACSFPAFSALAIYLLVNRLVMLILALNLCFIST